MTMDITERGLEDLIVAHMTGVPPGRSGPGLDDPPEPMAGLYGYVLGDPADYDREHALDTAQLLEFLSATQPEAVEKLGLAAEGPARARFLARLAAEIDKRGTVDVLRRGVKHGPASVDLFYGTPSPGNAMAEALFKANILSVVRQLRYSRARPRRALDLALFVNGLPVATFELKNRLTKRSAADAEAQYKRDRDPKERLFRLGRCVAHFAVDDREVRMCAHLRGRESWFLPFDKGRDGGAGNPPNPHGPMTDYLWREVLSRDSLIDILENYAQLVSEPGGRGKARRQVFPRYHQLDAVRRLLDDARRNGPGKRYLVQHSAGSGKSNTIAWLAHRLVQLEAEGKPVFDSVVVVTDRLVLDRQIVETVRQFTQVSATVGHADDSADLRRLLETGRKIVISTVQKFPFVLDEIGNRHRGRDFAIAIDEAHSSQGGRAAAAMNRALGAAGGGEDEEESVEDKINRLIESRRMLPNASYFAFTATPKNKTLEIFGDPEPQGDKTKHAAFHTYTMKQAIQEGFILDVLENYTPVESYYRVAKTVADDPEFDADRAARKLRRYVESHDHAIRRKAEIMIDHFHEHAIGRRKIGGKARAMVVADGVERAIRYFHAFRDYLARRKSPHKAIVAFSGEREFGGAVVTEASLNGFPSARIVEKLREEPYRFLIVADKFQTGYDEPLLHTMYVDKPLSGVRAVQTLSRLNRAHPGKHDAFVLDFANDAETIRAAFEPYYRATILGEETDPDKLHDLAATLERHGVYAPALVEEAVALFLGGAGREKLDPILDACAARYASELGEDGQVAFKGNAKAFRRTYGFLAAILPWGRPDWEKLSIFLNLLIPKLPAPVEEDLSRGILDTVDMDGYRVEARASLSVALADADSEIDPVPAEGAGGAPEPRVERLSAILREFNDLFGDIEWKDADTIGRAIAQDLPEKVAADPAYLNAARNSDEQNARVEHDRALDRAIADLVADHAELFRQFQDHERFRGWLTDRIFDATYRGRDGDGGPGRVHP